MWEEQKAPACTRNPKFLVSFAPCSINNFAIFNGARALDIKATLALAKGALLQKQVRASAARLHAMCCRLVRFEATLGLHTCALCCRFSRNY